ncbi:MAG TPA: hypothetical protein PLL75_01190 [Candidatus Omnitrophota bacterium]|nr:hypothetical protein [Candidatus Omnitrophota bacterium]HPS36328.1 hypothetical protein [Candidatus Omnitrophota bacterium]
MKSSKIVEGDLLFHAAHGLCRVERLIGRDRAGKTPGYSIVPRTMSRMKVRFLVPASDLEVSGFHRIVSRKAANKILDYLKSGRTDTEETDQAWVLARNILSFSADKLKTRDQRKRQLLEHSVRGLVGELACSFKITLREAVSKVEKSLMKMSKSDPLVFAALERAVED